MWLRNSRCMVSVKSQPSNMARWVFGSIPSAPQPPIHLCRRHPTPAPQKILLTRVRSNLDRIIEPGEAAALAHFFWRPMIARPLSGRVLQLTRERLSRKQQLPATRPVCKPQVDLRRGRSQARCKGVRPTEGPTSGPPIAPRPSFGCDRQAQRHPVSNTPLRARAWMLMAIMILK